MSRCAPPGTRVPDPAESFSISWAYRRVPLTLSRLRSPAKMACISGAVRRVRSTRYPSRMEMPPPAPWVVTKGTTRLAQGLHIPPDGAGGDLKQFRQGRGRHLLLLEQNGQDADEPFQFHGGASFAASDFSQGARPGRRMPDGPRSERSVLSIPQEPDSCLSGSCGFWACLRKEGKKGPRRTGRGPK